MVLICMKALPGHAVALGRTLHCFGWLALMLLGGSWAVGPCSSWGQGGTNVERAQKEGNFCYLAALTFAYHFEWNAMKCGLFGLKLGFLQCMITSEQLEKARQVISQR